MKRGLRPVCYIQILNTFIPQLQAGLRAVEDPYSWNEKCRPPSTQEEGVALR